MQPFDWQRIFIGDHSWLFLLEVVFRTAVMYTYAIGLLRLTGARGLGQLSALDVAIIVALGSAVGDPMFYPEVPLLPALIVITVVVAIQRMLTQFTATRVKVEGVLEGKPFVVVCKGRLDLQNMADGSLSQEDVFMRLRHQGVEQLGQVREAYMEHDGQVSVFKFSPEETLPGLPIVPPRDVQMPKVLTTEKIPVKPDVYACFECGETVFAGNGSPIQACPRCGRDKWVQAVE